MPALSVRFDQALLFASRVHREQRRKGGDVPYLAHLLAVTSLVLEAGGDEDQAIAALLHDALEDQPDQVTVDDLVERFGERVAQIVRRCSDVESHPKPPWRDRKEEHLDRLRQEQDDVLLVALADKLHNARSTLRDLRIGGPEVWRRFNAPRQDQLWYYSSLLEVFRSRLPREPMTSELRQAVEELAAGWTLACVEAK